MAITSHRIVLGLAIVAGSAATAHADVFAFKDLEGFEKCMSLDHLVESTRTDGGEQHRWLEPGEIQQRCVAAAVKLLAPTKNKDLALEFVKTTKRMSAPVQALPLIDLLVGWSLTTCNDMENYEVMMRPLDAPPDRWAFPRAKAIIKRCLKDGAFKKDFLDEQDSEEGHRGENACHILLEEKLVKACKGGKG